MITSILFAMVVSPGQDYMRVPLDPYLVNKMEALFDAAYGDRSTELRAVLLPPTASGWTLYGKANDRVAFGDHICLGATGRGWYFNLSAYQVRLVPLDTWLTEAEANQIPARVLSALEGRKVSIRLIPRNRGESYRFAWVPVLNEDPRISLQSDAGGGSGTIDRKYGVITSLMSAEPIPSVVYDPAWHRPAFSEAALEAEAFRVYASARPFRSPTWEPEGMQSVGLSIRVPDFARALNEMTPEHYASVLAARRTVLYHKVFWTRGGGGYLQQTVTVDARTGRGLAVEFDEIIPNGPLPARSALPVTRMLWRKDTASGHLAASSGQLSSQVRQVTLRSGTNYLSGDFDEKAGLIKLEGVVYRPTPELLAAMRRAPAGTFGIHR